MESSLKDIYDEVTRKIIAELENGAVPWVKTWKGGNGGIMPINAATRTGYSGINILILWATREEHGYPTPEWMTFKQSCARGGRVRKGEKGTAVVFTKPLTFFNDDDEHKVFMYRVYHVFNVAQIDALLEGFTDGQTELSPDHKDEKVDSFVTATGAHIRIGGDVSAFIPSQDFIKMPPVSAFKDMESYYATTFHELGHWSGGEKRLDRNLTTRFGTEAYAAEELVAELTS